MRDYVTDGLTKRGRVFIGDERGEIVIIIIVVMMRDQGYEKLHNESGIHGSLTVRLQLRFRAYAE